MLKSSSNLSSRFVRSLINMTKLNLDQAIQIATNTTRRSNMRHKLGAVLFDRRDYVVGYNRGFGVGVIGREHEFSLHSEEMAVIKGIRAGIEFESSTLVVIRVNNDGDFRSSMPCHGCRRLIEQMGIPRTYYVG
jgi:deoxycytidylate deaminase